MLIPLALTALLALGHVSSSKSKKRDYDPFHNECGIEGADRLSCGRRHDALGEMECLLRGCCFDNSDSVGDGVPRCFLAKRMLVPECNVHYTEKDDCGYYGIREVECLQRGCCWRPSDLPNDAECFHKAKSPVRLMQYDQQSEREGRLEIFHDDEWGTVCDDAFNDNSATVACKQLGFDRGAARCCGAFGSGSGQIWLDQVQCSGDESYLEDCNANEWGSHDCSHSEDVSVVCYNDDDPIPTLPPTTPYPYYYNYNEYGSGDYRFKAGNGKGRKGKRNNSFKNGFKNGGSKRSKGRGVFETRLGRKMPLLQGLQNILKKNATQ